MNSSGQYAEGITLSYILPFYKKYDELKYALQLNAQYYKDESSEVVLALDEPQEAERVMDLAIKEYSAIRWRIVVNDEPHDWRAPSVAINVGLRHSLGTMVLVASPESVLVTDPLPLAVALADCGERRFRIGRVVFCSHDDFDPQVRGSLQAEFEHWQRRIGAPYFYGSILAQKSEFFAIGGYDETLVKWGGDDDNVRIRLMRSGVRMEPYPDLRVIHLAKSAQLSAKTFRSHSGNRHSVREMIRALNPAEVEANPTGWGWGFRNVIYDWRDR